jgi:hypothetical protein
MKKLSVVRTLFIASLLMIPIAAVAGEITLAWDPNDEADLAGYRLYIQEGELASGFSLLADIPLKDVDSAAPSFSVLDLMADTSYHFVITAYNDNGDESGFSNSVCVINGQPGTGTNSATSSGGCFLDALNTPSAWKIPAPAH